MLCNESLFYGVFYDDKTSVYTTFKFLKNEIIKYLVSCILYPLCGCAPCYIYVWRQASAINSPFVDSIPHKASSVVLLNCQLLLAVSKWKPAAAVPMVTLAQSAANWRNTRTRVDRTHSLTHLHQPQLQPRGAKRQLSCYRIWNILYLFWRYLREGEQTGVPG